VQTDDPLYRACIVESATAAESAQHRMNLDALHECIEWRGVEPECCFARVTDDAPREKSRRETCEEQCAARRPAGRRYRRAPKCESEVVSYPLDALRFRTAVVDSLLEECARGTSDVNACERLPTTVERRYCGGACAAERADFVRSQRECIAHARAGLVVSCDHLFADKPIATPATMAARKAECERRCSAATRPARR